MGINVPCSVRQDILANFVVTLVNVGQRVQSHVTLILGNVSASLDGKVGFVFLAEYLALLSDLLNNIYIPC